MRGLTDPLVLIVDDEPDLLKIYGNHLKGLKIKVVSFGDPIEALEYLKSSEEAPDLLISDFMMPNMKGIEFLSEASKIFPGVNAILLSAFLDKEKVIEAANLGFVSIIEKPVNRQELQFKVEGFMFNSQSRKLKEKTTKLLDRIVELFGIFRVLCMDELNVKSVLEESLVADPNSPRHEAVSLELEIESLEAELREIAQWEQELRKAAS